MQSYLVMPIASPSRLAKDAYNDALTVREVCRHQLGVYDVVGLGDQVDDSSRNPLHVPAAAIEALNHRISCETPKSLTNNAHGSYKLRSGGLTAGNSKAKDRGDSPEEPIAQTPPELSFPG